MTEQVGLTVSEVAFSVVEASFDAGVTYEHIAGVSGVALTTGAASVETVEAFEGTAQRFGTAPIGSIACQAPGPAWALPVMKKLWDARQGQTTLKFRFKTVTKELNAVASTGKAAIAADGVVTLSGADGGKVNPDFSKRDLAKGVAIVLDGDDTIYVVTSINYTTGVATVAKPAAAQAATDFKLIVPGLQLGPFDAKITDGMGFDASLGGSVASEFTVTPEKHLSYFTLLSS